MLYIYKKYHCSVTYLITFLQDGILELKSKMFFALKPFFKNY